MTRRDWIFAIVVGGIALAGLVLLCIVVVDAMNSSWLCSHQWTAC